MEKTLFLTLAASLLMPLTAIHAAESLEQQFQNPPEEAKPSFGPEIRLKPVLPRVFGSKMILQRDREVPVWGWAEPGEEVAVSFAGQVKKTKADAHGKWIVKLAPMPASAESRTMVVKGNNEVRFDDVLVGEVWLASGQSNMYWTWGDILPEQRLQAQAEKDNRLIRSFHVKRVSAESPKSDIDGAWKDCAEMLTNAERFHPSPHSNPLIGESDNKKGQSHISTYF